MNEDKLRDMVIRLKEIESSDSYEELSNKIKDIEFDKGYSFEETRKYQCEILEKEILSYLKGVI